MTAQVWEEGMCGALAYDMTQGDDWETIYYNSTINFDDVLSDFDDDTKREVVAAVCKSSIYDGDHLTVRFAARKLRLPLSSLMFDRSALEHQSFLPVGLTPGRDANARQWARPHDAKYLEIFTPVVVVASLFRCSL